MQRIRGPSLFQVGLMACVLLMFATLAVASSLVLDTNISQQAITLNDVIESDVIETVPAIQIDILSSVVVVNSIIESLSTDLNYAPVDGTAVVISQLTGCQSGYSVVTTSDAVGLDYSSVVLNGVNDQFVNTLACGTTTVVLQFALLEQFNPGVIRGSADAVEIVVQAIPSTLNYSVATEHVIIDMAFLMGFNDSNFTTKAHGDAGGVTRGDYQYLVVI
jgi:hypothetical protein